MSVSTATSERVRVIQNPVWTMPQFREGQFRWQVYCDCCEPPEGGIPSLFWGGCLGGTNDWGHAVRYADEHARAHRRCGECGRIKPVDAWTNAPHPPPRDPAAASGEVE